MKNWPTLLAFLGSVLAPAAVKMGWLTTDQIGAVGVLAGPLFTWVVHRLPAPVKS